MRHVTPPENTDVQAVPAEPEALGPKLRRVAAWTGGVLAGLIALLILILLFMDWNWLRGPISRFASARLHREVAIDGDLKVHPWSWTPSATVERLRIGNPAWAGKGQMTQVAKVSTSIKLLPLLIGQVELPFLQIDRARVDLVRDKAGRANWDFSDGRKAAKPFKLPPIHRFVINDGQLHYADARRALTFDGTINAREKLGDRSRGFELTGKGALNRQPFLMRVTGGPLLNIERDKPYPFDADISAGATHVTARGAIPKPFDLSQFQMDANARGPDLADLYGLTGVTLPNTPPYRLSGRLSRDGRVFRITGLGGKIGDSDIAGALSVENGGERPLLKAKLTTRSLDFDDLAAVFGGAPAVGAGETVSDTQKAIAADMAAEQRFLPDATLKVDRIRAMDAQVDYRAAAIRDAPVPLRAGAVTINLKDGVLRAEPLDVSLAQGKLTGWVELDARLATPVTNLDLRLSNARLEQLLPIRNGEPPLTGAVVARLKLTGQGASVHRAAADSDGEMLVVVPNGEIRRAFAELLGINVTKGLGLLLSDNQDKTDIRCAVGHFQVRDGLMKANRIVFDTGPVLGVGEGTLNLDTEQMNFKIEGKPKKLRLVRLLAPITVKGPLRSPKVGIETGKAVAQGGFAALLASVATPLAAILPFIDPGLAKDAACGSLISAAAERGAPVKAAAR